jgi:hypothetical protein
MLHRKRQDHAIGADPLSVQKLTQHFPDRRRAEDVELMRRVFYRDDTSARERRHDVVAVLDWRSRVEIASKNQRWYITGDGSAELVAEIDRLPDVGK